MDADPRNASAKQHESTTSESRVRSSSSPQDSDKRLMDHDSLVTVRLSEPPALTVNTRVNGAPSRSRTFSNLLSPNSATSDARLEEEIMSPVTTPELRTPSTGSRHNLKDELAEVNEQSEDDDIETPEGGEDSEEDEEVDWEQLQKTEDKESQDNEEDSTAMLLARLEQENDKLATNPKSIKAKAVEQLQQSSRKTRPPSMAQLRNMVNGPAPPALRYSMLPPPPMTDLEFYAALVKDYQQTAARLPTLLANKIRKGIPPPLRGVVWQSMSGARDSSLEDQYDRLTGESSPYEGIIGKDLNRSFPGVDMFRDPDGDGQRMLGRVLKCYSLHDPKIGYCQGLALLVGPLLMHMADKQAFCVLVKLMENYDLRNSFTPDLFGLHVKIYQFRELLRLHLPALSGHLDDLQVDPAYVSQWFLSFFAVTCPLPMLFRIYDVIFAEGALETIMRVALSLMRRNQGRMLACTEMEDVMQLLLSRGLWDCYHYNADEFVHDFVSLSGVVTRERLAALEQGYRESQLASTAPSTTSSNAARASSEVTTAASRFLGRLWANSTNSLNTKSTSNLSPGLTATSRPLSMLRRSASKQSLASTLNSMEASSSSVSSAASVLSSSTEATSVSRDSATDDGSTLISRESKLNVRSSSRGGNSDSKNLHTQIEDLLTALSDIQRQHTLLADQLQREREERDEDRKAVRSLLDGLRKKSSSETVATSNSSDSDVTIKVGDSSSKDEETASDGSPPASSNGGPGPDRLAELLDNIEERFTEQTDKRRSSIQQTKSQMRDDLARAKEQLTIEVSRSQDANRRALDLEQEVSNLKDQLRDSHAHVRGLHTDKQRLEKQIHSMRVRASNETTAPAAQNNESQGWLSRSASTASTNSGLRELKLGRSKSTPSQTFTKRTSSLMLTKHVSDNEVPPCPSTAPVSEHDALLLELVQAKTAEAVARQEAEEAKQKLETMRKAFGLAPGDMPPVYTGLGASNTNGNSGAMSMLRSFTSPAIEVTAAKAGPTSNPAPAPAPAPAAAPASGGGFWGWRK